MRTLGNRRGFGRTREDRIKLIRAEIDAMTDREQMAALVEMPIFFRRMMRRSLVGTIIKLLGDERDNPA